MRLCISGNSQVISRSVNYDRSTSTLMVSQSRGLGEASSSSSPPGSTHVTTALISSVPNGGGNGVTKSCKNRSNPADFELDLTDFDKGPSKTAADHGKK